jgi:tetratricopeptide (TPR) repeat protein
MFKVEGTRLRTIGAIAVFLVSLAVYIFTLAPTVTFVDSGELIVAAKVLGVAHPPGFPLYVLLAHLATMVPIGNVAQRVNFASALFAATAVSFLFLLTDEMRRSIKVNLKLKEKPEKKSSSSSRKKKENTHPAGDKEETLVSLVPGFVAGLVLAFSRTLWSFATVAEVYTLNTLLIIVVCLLMFRWRATQEDKFLYLAALVFGAALGVHHVTVGVTLPALAVLVYKSQGWRFFKSKQLLYCALFAIAATILVYFYLPLAARGFPVMNWGDPRTLQRFWWHITGHQYQVFFSFSPEQIANQASQLGELVIREFSPVWSPVPLILAVLGFVDLFRRERTIFWFLSLIIIADLAYSLNYEIAEDKGAYYLPAFTSVAIAAGFGASFFLSLVFTKATQTSGKVAAAIGLIILVPLLTFSGNYRFTNRRNFYLASDYIANIERPIPPRGMLLTSDWQVYSPLFYFREVEQVRPDIVAIDINLLRRSWYFDYLRTQYPDLLSGSREAVEPFLNDLRRWEQDPDLFARSNTLTRQINDHFHQMIMAFIDKQIGVAPVFVTLEVGTGGEDKELAQLLGQKYQLIPEGLVFRLGSAETFQSSIQPEIVTRGLNDGSFSFTADDVVTLKVISTYAIMMINRGRYLESIGKKSDAIEAYEKALTIDPTSVMAREQLSRARNGQP